MKTLTLLGSLCALSLSLGCAGGYSSADASDDGAPTTAPRQVTRAAETPAAVTAEDPSPELTEAPAAQPDPAPATTPSAGNHADAGPAPVAVDPPSPPPSVAADAGPAPVAPVGLWAPCALEADCSPYGLTCATSPTHPSTATPEGWVCRPVPQLAYADCTQDEGCASGHCFPQAGKCSAHPLPQTYGDYCEVESDCGGYHCNAIHVQTDIMMMCCPGADPTCGLGH